MDEGFREENAADSPPRTPAGIGVGNIMIILAVVWTAFMVFAGLAALIAAIAFQPRPYDGFDVTNVDCAISPSGDLYVQLTATSLDDQPNDFRVESVTSDTLRADGAMALPPGQQLGTLNQEQFRIVADEVHDSDGWATVATSPTVVVIGLSRVSDAVDEASLTGIRLWWSRGEPAYVQDVPITATFDRESCSVG